MKNQSGLVVLVLMIMVLNSCRVFYPDRLFKIPEDQLVLADTLSTPKEYRIRPGDLIALGVFSNNGYQLVDVLTPGGASFSAIQYLVKPNGFVNLPMLDSVKVEGMSIDRAEKFLADQYSYYFVNPFIRVEVTNRSVYVFRGRGSAVVVTLDHDNTSLIEVISKAGGIPVGAKAYRVRLIRGNLNAPMIFDINLSTVEGMKSANLTMVADDVVYIETRYTVSDAFAVVLPYITAFTTILALVLTVDALSK